MTFATTDPKTLTISNGQDYLITASGGDITIKRQLESLAWETIPGSPLLAGEHKRLLTSSSSYLIQCTPSLAGAEFSADPII
jgi:hypothetical protein